MLDKLETRSEKEIIKILEENGIRVVIKPVAFLPDNYSVNNYNRESMSYTEHDIYEAIRILENRRKILIDPFSK